jgi:outer membrane protein
MRARYFFSQPFFLDAEPMLDFDNMFSANIRAGAFYKKQKYMINPYVEAKIKSTDYNSRYFGLTMEKINAGIDYSLGVIADARIFQNLYLYGSAKITLLDKNARAAKLVEDDFTGEFYLGFGFSNDPLKPKRKKLSNRPFLRLSQGFATPNAFNQVVFFNIVPDTNHNKLTSVFYGYPLTDQVFGIPLGLYITTGFAWHWKSEVQSSAQELVLAMKAYYTIHWPIRWRIGLTEGVSYLNKITYIEQEVYDRKDYEPVHFLNYLDFSLDFNVGDIFSKRLENIWIGYNVHHRSGIFELSQQYGRVNIGSNYYSFHIQYDL